MQRPPDPDQPRRNRLPRRFILRGRTRFDRLFEKGRTVRSGSLLIRSFVVTEEEADRERAAYPLAAFVVAKKHGRAVDRNRTKRLLREAWRLIRSDVVDRSTSIEAIRRLEFAIIWIGPPARVRRPEFKPVRSDLDRAITKLIERLDRIESKGKSRPE